MPRHRKCGGDCELVGGPALYDMVGGKKSWQLEATIAIVNNSQGVRTSASTGGMNLASRENGRAGRRSTMNLDRTLAQNPSLATAVVGERDPQGAAGLPPAA